MANLSASINGIRGTIETVSMQNAYLRNALVTLLGPSAYGAESAKQDTGNTLAEQSSIDSELKRLNTRLSDESMELARLVSLLEKAVADSTPVEVTDAYYKR